MTIKTVIAGCRNYNDYEEAKKFLDKCFLHFVGQKQIIIFSGGCKGADEIGEKYAEDNGFELKQFYADWRKYGRAAGPKRNEEMVKQCDLVICFWDGKSKGTKSLIQFAKKYGKTVMTKLI